MMLSPRSPVWPPLPLNSGRRSRKQTLLSSVTAVLLLWLKTGERPVCTTLTAGKVHAVQRDVAHVSLAALYQTSAMSGFAVFIADGEFIEDSSVP